MNIESARYAEDDSTVIATIDGVTVSIPADPANRHHQAIVDWVGTGGVIALCEAPPVKRRVPKSTIIARLTDEQLDAALALMTTRQKERWRAPDHPAVDVDDPELLAVLAAVGADPEIVLTP